MKETNAMSVEQLLEQGYEEDPKILQNWLDSFSYITTPGCLLIIVGGAGFLAAVKQIVEAVLPQDIWLMMVVVGFALMAAPVAWTTYFSAPKSPVTGRRMDRFTYKTKGGGVVVFVCHASRTFCRKVLYYKQ